MLILKIIGVVLAAAAIFGSLWAFNQHCQKKFSYRFFNSASAFATALAIGLGYGGYNWRESAITQGGDPLNGLILMIFGVIVAAVLIYFNFKKTNVLYGVGGTVIQLIVFSILTYFLLIIGFIAIFLAILFAGAIGSGAIKPVYVINRK